MKLQDVGPNINVVLAYRVALNVSSLPELIMVLDDWKELCPDALDRAKHLAPSQFDEFVRVRQLTLRFHAELPPAMMTRYGAILLPNIILYLAVRSKAEKKDNYTVLGQGIRAGDIIKSHGALYLNDRLAKQVERGERIIIPGSNNA